MARLIDADELIAEFEWLKSQVSSSSALEIQEHIQRIKDAPTVDAVEVAHGRWKHQYEKGMSYKVCSICGCRNGLDLKFNYCPNCGAKMDGDENG